MSKEQIYNLFVFLEENAIKSLGICVHEMDGSDDEKVAFLQASVNVDFASARRYTPDKPLSAKEYEARMRLGRHLEIFEDIFREHSASNRPLCVVTTIEGGTPQIRAALEHGPTTLSKLKGTLLGKPGIMIDYLEKYVEGDSFDLPRLINDDYFKAIKLLYNGGLCVSAAKLLMSAIDSIAFVEFGDTQDIFIRWLDRYADLVPLEVTPRELWEFRNGILHMTNLHSRNVQKGQVKSLILSVGSSEHPPLDNPSWKILRFKPLLEVMAEAISKWVGSYNEDRDKILDFVARYDLTVSDSRLTVIALDK
jgi:hypothetical protein